MHLVLCIMTRRLILVPELIFDDVTIYIRLHVFAKCHMLIYYEISHVLHVSICSHTCQYAAICYIRKTLHPKYVTYVCILLHMHLA